MLERSLIRAVRSGIWFYIKKIEDYGIGRNYCMDEHLSKPVDIAVLERAVRKYLVTLPENERPSTEIYPVSP